MGEFGTARDYCDAALVLHRHHSDPAGEAATLNGLGFIARRTVDHRQALDYYHQALTLFRTLSNTYKVADIIDNVGHPHVAPEEHEQARRRAEHRQAGGDGDGRPLTM